MWSMLVANHPYLTPWLLRVKVVNSILFYAATFWGKSLQVSCSANKLSISRLVFLALRTVSDDVAFVISEIMPIDILALL